MNFKDVFVKSFSTPILIESDDNTDVEFSYPAAITDGKYIYITYIHYRKTVMFVKFEIIPD